MSELETKKTFDEVIRSQEPLPPSYESTDFKQGINRGRFLENKRVIELIEAGAWAGESLEEDIANLKKLLRIKPW